MNLEDHLRRRIQHRADREKREVRRCRQCRRALGYFEESFCHDCAWGESLRNNADLEGLSTPIGELPEREPVK